MVEESDEEQQVAPYIQMVSALMLQMIHAIVAIPLDVSDDEEKQQDEVGNYVVDNLMFLMVTNHTIIAHKLNGVV